MTLSDAVAAVVAEFPQADGDTKSPAENCIDVTSGGLRISRDVEPALYASRELAVESWQREALAILRERSPRTIVLVDGPHLDKWLITVADRMNTQRVSEPRWSVTSRIGLIGPGEGQQMSSLATLEAKIDKLQETLDRMAPPAEKPAETASPETVAAPTEGTGDAKTPESSTAAPTDGATSQQDQPS